MAVETLKWILLRPFFAPILLLGMVVIMVALAFPQCASLLTFDTSSTIHLFPLGVVVLIYLIVYGLLQQQLLHDGYQRRWIAGLFHLGVLSILIGGGLTALGGRSLQVEMAQTPESEPQVFIDNTWIPLEKAANEPHILPEWRMLWISGRWVPIYPYTLEHLLAPNLQTFPIAAPWSQEHVTLKDFTIERYPNDTPKQYRTTLTFEEGDYDIAVNQPLRRKGLTYYQMSYAHTYLPAIDRYENPIYFRMLALDDKGEPRFDERGYPVYNGNLGEYPVGFPVVCTQLSIRKDPGAPVTFVGYGLLILATFLLAIREERQ